MGPEEHEGSTGEQQGQLSLLPQTPTTTWESPTIVWILGLISVNGILGQSDWGKGGTEA